jgi:hypothetical protein
MQLWVASVVNVVTCFPTYQQLQPSFHHLCRHCSDKRWVVLAAIISISIISTMLIKLRLKATRDLLSMIHWDREIWIVDGAVLWRSAIATTSLHVIAAIMRRLL